MKIRLSSRPVIGLLFAAGVASVAAFVLAPAAVLSGAYGDFQGEAALRAAVGRGLAEYWHGGGAAYPPLLDRLVDYWFRWHAIKVGISAVMLLTFAALATALWRRYLHGPARRAVSAIGVTVLAVLATGVLILNIQATAVPVVALLPLTAGGPTGGEPARTFREMRAGLTPGGPHADSPVLTTLVGEVERYHWLMVGMAAALTVAASLAGAYLWRRRGTGDSRARSMRKALGAVLAGTAALLLVMVAFSAASAADPADTLRAVLNGV